MSVNAMIYAVIVFSFFIRWGFMRYQLHRGLDVAFIQIRKTDQLNKIFTTSQKQYYFQLSGLIVNVAVLAFCGYRLLFLMGTLSVDIAVVYASIVLFYLKDSYHFQSAMFFMKRANQ